MLDYEQVEQRLRPCRSRQQKRMAVHALVNF